jgi:hypothetical protein
MKRETIIGSLVANAFGLGMIAVTKLISGSGSLVYIASIFTFSDFIIVPMLMGIILAYSWRKLSQKGSDYFWYAVGSSLVTLAGSYFFLEEGYICIIIISPLLMGFVVAGIYTGRVMFRKNRNTLNVSLFSLLLVITVLDSFTAAPYETMVSDKMIIKAPPEKIWPYVVAYEPISEKSNYWLFRIGMPSPVQSTADGYYEGAGRKCIFSNGYTFDEKMTVFQPPGNLTFDITNQPRDPEIMGHIDILRGQFILEDNGDGTTTLTGNSWYRLYVSPSWYFNSWAASITRNVHLRVMEHIKMLSEKNV